MPFATPASSLSPRSMAALLSLLEIAQQEHVVVTRTKLAKLLYFADLDAVADDEARPTDIEWKWLDHGPYENALMFAENELADAKTIVRRSVQYVTYSGTELTLIDHDYPRPDAATVERLRAQVRKYGRLAAVSIKDLAYQTPPMLAAQRTGERGVVLDLDLVKPRPDISVALGRLRAVRESLEPVSDGSEIASGMQEISDSLAQYRTRATALLLGD